jgi:PhnB protein
MATQVKTIPDGYHTLTPYLIARGAKEAIDFYKRAFGAEEINCMPGPDGKSVAHAELKIGDSRFMLTDEFPTMGTKGPQTLGGSPVGIFMYVQDVDTSFQRAVKAGATEVMPVKDMFWGDRYGKLRDPFGHEWSLATHKKDLTPEEIGKAAREFFSQMPK